MHTMIRILILLIGIIVLTQIKPAYPHGIYTGISSKGHLCCGGNDCSLTSYREDGSEFEFLTREGHWIKIPIERIEFLPIPGDPPHNDTHAAHLCYGPVEGYEGLSVNMFSGDGQRIILYCAFIPPGGV